MPTENVTPSERIPFWTKKWGKAHPLDDAAAEKAFDEFMDAFVPGHMQKRFYKMFWSSKSKFDNRYFVEDATFRNWDTKIGDCVFTDQGPVEATVIYGSPDRIEAHLLKGEMRRSLRDVIMDDWQVACAIIRTKNAVLYLFVEPKMKGCVVRMDTL